MTNLTAKRVREIFESGSYGSDVNPIPFTADDMTSLAEDSVVDAMRWRSFDNEPNDLQWIEVLCNKSGDIHTISYLRERTKDTDLGWRPAMPFPEFPIT